MGEFLLTRSNVTVHSHKTLFRIVSHIFVIPFCENDW